MLRQKLMGGAGVEPVFVEDVMSTYLYTGNGSTQTINNGIDLAGEGGLVWIKQRTESAPHCLFDTLRGTNDMLHTDTTQGNDNVGFPVQLQSYNANGFTLRADGINWINTPVGSSLTSWTFRKAPKFFDVVTWTGDGVAGRPLSHALASAPGCIIMKCTSSSGDWFVWHIGNGGGVGSASPNVFGLNSANAAQYVNSYGTMGNSSVFFPTSPGSGFNNSGQTYVAYLFANNTISDPGNFGLTGTDNVIRCGSYVGDGTFSHPLVNLGWEPQWVLTKVVSTSGDWCLLDNLRGIDTNSSDSKSYFLDANLSGAEGFRSLLNLNARGFVPIGAGQQTNLDGETYIYIAIRRGPMKVPTTGTSVFTPVATSSSDNPLTVTTNFPVDMLINRRRLSDSNYLTTRLIGSSTTTRRTLNTDSDSAEFTATGYGIGLDNNTAAVINGFGTGDSTAKLFWLFRRAPGFFDKICFSGTGANTTQAHNLQKAPELWLVKSRSATTEWVFGSSLLGANEKIVMPAPNGRVTDTTVWNNTYPTTSVLSLGTSSTTNANGATFVSYLWATVAGVSKVGTYTGNGSSQTIDCGFAGGARFVMIIRATASTAQDIYVWDSARGIVAGNDPRLSLNTTAAEVTTLDSVDATSTGFIVNTDASNVNEGGTVYLYWSIA